MTRQFTKDDPRINRDGRPPGSTERVKEIRDRIGKIVETCYKIEDIKTDIAKLKPAERLNLLDKLLKHVLPPVPPENILDGMSDTDLERLINYLKKEMN